MTTTGMTDGRAARKAATRTAIADALLDLLTEGQLRPTAREIAARAGISVRSVYVHFDDLEDLFCVAAKRHFGRIAPMLEPVATGGSTRERVESLVTQRVQLFTKMGTVARATQLQAPFSPTLARIVHDAHARSRAEIERVFATELDALSKERRAQVSAVVDVLSSGHAWETLRESHHMSYDDAYECVVSSIVTALEVRE